LYSAKGRIVAYFSQKLSNAQRNHITMEKEMLYDNTVWNCIECYLNFPDSDTPEENPLRTNGPYTIDRVHVIGTLTIVLHPGVTERMNYKHIADNTVSLIPLPQ
jgi:hypothetical protein